MANKKTLARKVIQGFAAHKSKRSNFDSWIKDITFYILPEYESQEAGQKDSTGNFDRPVSSVATEAAIKLGGNLYSYTYSQGDRNFVLRAPDSNESDEMKEWLEDAGDAAIKAIQNSNFSEVYGEMCTLFGTYGTGPVATEWDAERGELLMRNHSINGEIFLIEDKDGRVNGIVRKLRYTAEQAVEKYGSKNLPASIVKAVDDPSKMAETFEFVHMIRKNASKDRNPKLKDIKNMAYQSTHVSVLDESVVKESGYRTFPFACPRFIKIRDFAYGYGAGHMTVNAIRELNKAESDLRDAIELAAKPPVFSSDEDSGADKIEPGKIIYMDMTTGQPVVYKSNADVGVLHQRVMQLSAQVERQFFLDVFMALSHYADQSKTLGEAQMIENEKLSSIGPMVSRLRSEFWVPFIERVLDLLIENGRITEPPGDVDYKIVYTSRIDAQLAAINATETIRAINEAAQLLELSAKAPELEKIVHLRDAARELLENRNLPLHLIVSKRERDEMDKADVMAAEQANQKEQMSQLAGGLDPNKAPEDGSVMQQLNSSVPMPGAPRM
jgi:hypothetical protein